MLVASFHSTHVPGVLCPSFSTAMGREQGKARDVASTVVEGREPLPHAQIHSSGTVMQTPAGAPTHHLARAPRENVRVHPEPSPMTYRFPHKREEWTAALGGLNLCRYRQGNL